MRLPTIAARVDEGLARRTLRHVLVIVLAAFFLRLTVLSLGLGVHIPEVQLLAR